MNFDPITYNEAASLRKHFVLLNGEPATLEYLLTPGLTGAALQGWLGTPANMTSFQRLIATTAGAAALCASSTAMTAIAASAAAMLCMQSSFQSLTSMLNSTTAMNAVAANNTAVAGLAQSAYAMPHLAGNRTAMRSVAANANAVGQLCGNGNAMTIVAASKDGMDEIAGSSVAMAVIANNAWAFAVFMGSPIARLAMYDSGVAWAAIAASSKAKANLSAIATEASTASQTHVHPPGVYAGVRVALVQQKSFDATRASYAGAVADTYSTISTTWVDRYERVSGLSHRSSYIGGQTGQSFVRYVVMQ